MAVNIELDLGALGEIREAAARAALKTMEAVKTDIVASHTMPMNNESLQDSLHSDQIIDGAEIHTGLSTDQPYARYLYFGELMLAENGSSWAPEGGKKHLAGKPLNFQKGKNQNAGPRWYEPYEPGGEKEDFIPRTFEEELRRGMAE